LSQYKDEYPISYNDVKKLFASDKINESIVVVGNKKKETFQKSKKKSDRIKSKLEIDLKLRYVEFETSWEENEQTYEEVEE